ncbi:TetR/AcrR family transcriptional regulator [Rhodococcus sp. UFZ-B548]|uniref:TetR/AcrR family transcriptional regulator n=1 Tax=Rhodococcus sp. UFZ-B548 TaxID=2742212 RepID=UPI0037C8B19B
MSPADRLIDAATELFSRNGIRAVGIDRILADAGVARASMYTIFGSKEALIAAYLERLDVQDRRRWKNATDRIVDPGAKILAFFDLAIDSAPGRGFRGCQYSNAATEFPDDPPPAVQAHRAWVLDTIENLLTSLGCPRPTEVAYSLRLIYDGALVGSKFENSSEPIRLGRSLAQIAITQAC